MQLFEIVEQDGNSIHLAEWNKSNQVGQKVEIKDIKGRITWDIEERFGGKCWDVEDQSSTPEADAQHEAKLKVFEEEGIDCDGLSYIVILDDEWATRIKDSINTEFLKWKDSQY